VKTRASQRRWYLENKDKVAASNAKWYAANRDAARNSTLKRLYGIDLAQYNRMLSDQGGCCAICKTGVPGGKGGRWFHVDHCHATGQVRKLLCSSCNAALGYFKDSPTVVAAAVLYLQEHGK
jgi:Autographiviridae endonuclease VII